MEGRLARYFSQLRIRLGGGRLALERKLTLVDAQLALASLAVLPGPGPGARAGAEALIELSAQTVLPALRSCPACLASGPGRGLLARGAQPSAVHGTNQSSENRLTSTGVASSPRPPADSSREPRPARVAQSREPEGAVGDRRESLRGRVSVTSGSGSLAFPGGQSAPAPPPRARARTDSSAFARGSGSRAARPRTHARREKRDAHPSHDAAAIRGGIGTDRAQRG